jgi:glycosyltransferase involved in cell wall biosynthesis
MKRLIQKGLLAFQYDLAFLRVYILHRIKRVLWCEVGDEKSVLLFGAPILSLSNIAKSLNHAGFAALTAVPEVYSINTVEDFDLVAPSPRQFYERLLVSRTWIVYFDSFQLFFGFLRFFPGLLKSLCGARIIAMPYGRDAYEYSLITDDVLKHALLMNYPHNSSDEARIALNKARISDSADIVIGCIGHVLGLFRWDALPVHYYPVDIDYIDELASEVRKRDKFTIVHSPNHRGIKGTDLIISAVRELVQSGHSIDLILLEKVPNHEVIKSLHSAHLLIEQVIGGGYALSAMEGMACGIPVISHLNENICGLFRVFSHFDECPIVSCERSVSSIKDKILYVMENHQSLSRLSRKYVETYHSIPALAAFWRAVLTGASRTELMTFYMKRDFSSDRTSGNPLASLSEQINTSYYQ